MSQMCCYLGNTLLPKCNHRLNRRLHRQFQNVSFSKLRSMRRNSTFPPKELAGTALDLDSEDNDHLGGFIAPYNPLYRSFEDDKQKSANFRNQLFPTSEDPLVNKLKECMREEDVYQALDDNSPNLNTEHLSQALLILRDLQLYSTSNLMHPQSSHPKISSSVTSSHFDSVLSDPKFTLLLDKVGRLKCQFDVNALACTVLNLQKLGCSQSHPVTTSLVIQLEKLIKCPESDRLLIPALSKYATFMRGCYQTWTPYFLSEVAAMKGQKCLVACSSFKDLKHLGIFYHRCLPLVTAPVMDLFGRKIVELVDNVDPSDGENLVRLISFLASLKFEKNDVSINLLMNSFLERNVTASLKNCFELTEIFSKLREPHSLIDILHKVLSDSEQSVEDKPNQLVIAHLKTVASNYSIKTQHRLQKELIREFRTPSDLQENFSYYKSLYCLVRNVAFIDKRMIMLYWSRALRFLEENCCPDKSFILYSSLSLRYMQFNSRNLRIRHHNFEQRMCGRLTQGLKMSIHKTQLSSLAYVVAFSLAYGEFQATDVLDEAFKKLVSSINRLEVIDWLVLSTGLHLALKLRRKETLSSEFLQKFVNLSALLNEAALDYLNRNQSIEPRKISCLAISFHYRHGVVDTILFQKIIKRIGSIKAEDFSPRLIFETIRLFQTMNYFSAEFLESAAEYVIKHNKELKVDFVDIVVNGLYQFGYNPRCAESFFPIACELIEGRKHLSTCLNLIRASISLAFFHRLTPSLMQTIFDVKFLDSVDEEIKLNSVKTFYPRITRNSLLELNRTVCLDYPEQNIPWFHARYCVEINALDPQKTSSFHEDVQETLIHILGDAKLFQKNVFSPYNYKIDFQILLNWNAAPLEAKFAKNLGSISRVAIILLSKKDLALPEDHLRGGSQLRQRHLELMGYHVVHVNPILWNTMFMTEMDSKADYLKKQIWPKN